jgi:hypothetical protein
MNAKLKVVVGSLLGAVAIHGLLAACGGSGTGSARDGGVFDALIDAFQEGDAKAAGDGGTACAAWQVNSQGVISGGQPTLLGGEEPFAVTWDPASQSATIWTRGCQ